MLRLLLAWTATGTSPVHQRGQNGRPRWRAGQGVGASTALAAALVIVEDRAHPHIGFDEGVGCIAEVDVEELVELPSLVSVDRDGDGLSRLVGRERHRSKLGHVVVVGRRGRTV